MWVLPFTNWRLKIIKTGIFEFFFSTSLFLALRINHELFRILWASLISWSEAQIDQTLCEILITGYIISDLWMYTSLPCALWQCGVPMFHVRLLSIARKKVGLKEHKRLCSFHQVSSHAEHASHGHLSYFLQLLWNMQINTPGGWD